MKAKTKPYRVVKVLPQDALTVAEYADRKGYTHNNIYNIWRRHVGPQKQKIDFEIVLFRTVNFVIPKKVKA